MDEQRWSDLIARQTLERAQLEKTHAHEQLMFVIEAEGLKEDAPRRTAYEARLTAAERMVHDTHLCYVSQLLHAAQSSY